MSTQSSLEGHVDADEAPSARSRERRVHVVGVGALSAVIAAIYSGYALVNFANFRDSSYDLVIFDQAVRSYAHLHLGISIIKGVHNGFGPHFSVLGDHFSPVLAALAPLYWIFDGPQTLLVAQSALFALAIPPLWIFTRRAFGGTGRKATTAAYLVALAYGLSWPLAAAAQFGFHEVAFAPVLTAIAMERFQAGRLRPALIALGGLLLVKEDMGLLVAGIGAALALSLTPTVRRQRLVGIALIIVGVAYTAFATYVLIPAFGGRADYYWAYSVLGNNVPHVIGHIVRHPISSLQMLITPSVKLHTMAWLVAVFCFLPLLSPLVLAVVPLLLERMLNSKYPSWWLAHFHYNAYLVVILVCAAVDGAARLDRWATAALSRLSARQAARTALDGPRVGTGRPGTGLVAVGCCAAMVLVTLATLPRFAFGEALHAGFYHRDARARAAASAEALVPSGVVVEAANSIGPELSSRDTVLLWDGEQPPLGSPWIVADVLHHQMTFANVAAQRTRVALLIRSGYKVVFKREGYIVLHRAKASPFSPAVAGE